MRIPAKCRNSLQYFILMAGRQIHDSALQVLKNHEAKDHHIRSTAHAHAQGILCRPDGAWILVPAVLFLHDSAVEDFLCPFRQADSEQQIGRLFCLIMHLRWQEHLDPYSTLALCLVRLFRVLLPSRTVEQAFVALLLEHEAPTGYDRSGRCRRYDGVTRQLIAGVSRSHLQV